jgi:L-rhamnose mutarotase
MSEPSIYAAASICVLLTAALFGNGCSQSDQQGDNRAEARKVERYGSVIGLKSDKKDYYNELHANPWPEIIAMLKRCNIQNYSIYECEIDGKLYLFSYFEYTGDDIAADMEKMKADKKTIEWWAETDPCQIRLSGTPEGEQWLPIEEVFHSD